MPAYIVIVASFVTIIQFLLQGFVPSALCMVSILPLIVVNCIILGRAESYASKNPALPSMFDGIGIRTWFHMCYPQFLVQSKLLGGGTILSTGSSALVDVPNFGYTPASYIYPCTVHSSYCYVCGCYEQVKRKHGMKAC